MGVPAFYRWLSQRYPKAIKPALVHVGESVDGIEIPQNDYLAENPNGELDNLYLDMNGIVHPCTHPEGRPAPETEDEMMLEVFRYTDRVLSIAKPRKVLIMAVDGVAPRAKMNQQRSRRFRAAQDARAANEEELRKAELAAKLGESLDTAIRDPTKKKWDTNVITPGTPFMDFLARSLRYWVAYKMNTEPGWANLKVIISDATVPGEGEHKIMEFIRSQRNEPDYNPQTTHCIYGLDADLIFLGLATHEPNFRVLREDVFNQNKQAGKDKGHIWLDIGVLRQYLEIELDVEANVVFWDLERAIDDWIFMAFFCGNDFLPHLPSLDVRENGLDILLRSWRQKLPSMGGFLTRDGDVVLSRVQTMLAGVASQEGNIFRNRHEIEKKREASRKQQQMAKRMRKVGYKDLAPTEELQLYDAKGNAVNYVNESVKNEVKEETDDVKEEDEEEEEDSGKAQVIGEDPASRKRKAADADEDDDDDVKLWAPGYRERYYEAKFGVNRRTDPKFIHDMAYHYIEGVCWVLKYYYQGCPSWTWFYPYHYAPFAQDLVDADMAHFDIKFPSDTQPFLPFEQLMSVLPADSSHTLPKLLRPLMSDPDSPIIDFYPENFPIDMNGKKMSWQGIALLPFIDETRLLTEIRKMYPQLSQFDMSRNVRKEAVMLVGPHCGIHDKLEDLYKTKSSTYLTCTEGEGICGQVECDPEWRPNQPLVPFIKDSPFESLALDKSVCVVYILPANQSSKSMLVPGFKEPELVLGPSDIDTIWDRRRRSDRGDERPYYRKQKLMEFSEARPKHEGTYSGFIEKEREQSLYASQNEYHGQGAQQGYQGSRGSYQGYQGGQGAYQGYQGGQGAYQGYRGNQGHQGYRGNQGHQGYQGYGNSGYQSQGNHGYQNQGYHNQGYQNQGYHNQGYHNQGYQNSQNRGYQGHHGGYQGNQGRRNQNRPNDYLQGGRQSYEGHDTRRR